MIIMMMVAHHHDDDDDDDDGDDDDHAEGDYDLLAKSGWFVTDSQYHRRGPAACKPSGPASPPEILCNLGSQNLRKISSYPVIWKIPGL